MVSLFAPLCLPGDSFSFRPPFFIFFPPFFTNSFQWLSNWKMEMLLLPSISAPASWQQSNFLSSGINGIEQYILIKKEPMIAGLPVCHLSTKSSPSRPTTVLSDLIMSRIKSREGKGVGGWWTNANPSLTIVLFVTNIKFGSTFWDVASFVTGFSS